MKHLATGFIFISLLIFLLATAVDKLKKLSAEFGWSWLYSSFYIVPCIFFTVFTGFVCWVEYLKYTGTI